MGIIFRNQVPERRSMMAGYPNGWGWSDPAAIPPPGIFSMQHAGVPVTPHTALQVGAVHRCMAVLCNSVTSLGEPDGTLYGYRYASDKDGRPYRAYMSPQPGFLGAPFGTPDMNIAGVTRMVISLGLFGEYFLYVTSRDYYGNASSVSVLHPGFITVNEVDGQPVYFYGPAGKKIPLDPGDVVHIEGLSLPGGRRGLNNITYEGPAIAIALAAQEYGGRWFSQGASPGYLITTDAKVSQPQLQRLQEAFYTEHAGLSKSHLPITMNGDVHVEKLGSTPDEAQFLQTLEYYRQEIGGFFGVPAHLLGATGNDSFWGKGVEEANLSFLTYTLSGYLGRIEAGFTSLLPRGQFASFDRKKLVKANAADMAKLIQQLRLNTLMTENEIRRDYLDLPPIDGGDDLHAPLASNVPAPGGADAVDLPEPATDESSGDS